jgi:pyridoxamine 5'-phosphate oxidase
MSIADIRKEYKLKSLGEQDVDLDAIDQFTIWWNDALDSNIDEVNAMTLATASKEGIPSARIVLLKGYDKDGFVFYTNYKSQKGKEIAENNNATILFFWKELERQVNIKGTIEKVSEQESDEYFYIRPAASRIGAWSSPQSAVISSRKVLEENEIKFREQYGNDAPRPPHWGGYRLKPHTIEFWQGRESRLHDRLLYTLQENGGWKIERLAP